MEFANIVRIAAGGSDAFGHSIAVAADGTVYAWGCNSNGQLGNGSTSTAATKLPVAVGGGSGSLGLLPKPPDVTLALSITQSFSPGAVTMTASPTDPDNNITKVEFFSQGLLVGQATTTPWQLNLNNLPAGSNHIYAKVSDSSGLAGYSLPQDFSISPPDLDNDGLSDDWELQHFGNLDQSASGDSDNDGLTNAGEFAQGTHPLAKDSDGDGMDDALEIAAGLDPTSNDENRNGQNDAYEDFDDDSYINREEAICGTKAKISGSKPDGTSASIVFSVGEVSSADDAPGSGSVGGTPVLLVRNYNFDIRTIRSAGFSKKGERGFLPGSIGENPMSASFSDDVDRDVDSWPKYYLEKTTVETVDEKSDEHLTEEEMMDPNLELSLMSWTINGTRTTKDTIRKVDGLYASESAVSGTAHEFESVTEYWPPQEPWTGTLTWDYDFADPDDGAPLDFCRLGDASAQILSDTEARTAYSLQWDNRTVPFYRDTGSVNNSKTVTLANEYTDEMLIADLGEALSAADWHSPGQYETGHAEFLWDEPNLLNLPHTHESAGFKDVRYRLVSNVPGGISQTTLVKYIWKEVFVPQQGEGGEVHVKWFEDGAVPVSSGPQTGQFATPEFELKHPDKPGSIIPDYNRNGIHAPFELAALNPGETKTITRIVRDSQGNEKPDLTIHRGNPILFQTDLADQKNHPKLTASGDGTVTLWELKKDGEWLFTSAM